MKKISIIIPVYNEEKTIVKILEIIHGLDLDLNKEIIIVNDGSRDKSKEIIQNYLIKNKRYWYCIHIKGEWGKRVCY